MRRFYLILLILFVLMFASCAAPDNGMAEDAADGVSFDYFTTYVINDIEYEVYIPNKFEDAIYYDHKLGDITSSSSEWTINFMYEPIYHVNDRLESKEVWNSLYTNLENNKEVLDEKAGFTVKLFAPYEAVEVEYVLHNEVKQEARYVIFYTYLPIRLLNKSRGRTITIGVPINLDVLLKVDDLV